MISIPITALAIACALHIFWRHQATKGLRSASLAMRSTNSADLERHTDDCRRYGARIPRRLLARYIVSAQIRENARRALGVVAALACLSGCSSDTGQAAFIAVSWVILVGAQAALFAHNQWSYWAHQALHWRELAENWSSSHERMDQIAAESYGHPLHESARLMAEQDKASALRAASFADKCSRHIPSLIRARYLLAAALVALLACSTDPDPCAPLTVNIQALAPDQEADANTAIFRWNTAVGYPAIAIVSRDPDIRITRKIPPHGAYVLRSGGEIEIGKRADGPCVLEQQLGLALGLPLDKVEGSVMNPGPFPNCYILPQHVAKLRARDDGACRPASGWPRIPAMDASAPPEFTTTCEAVGEADGGGSGCGAIDKVTP